MKIFTKLTATLVMILLASLFVTVEVAWGQTGSSVPPALPELLPIGNTSVFLERTVTNESSMVAIHLTYTNRAGASVKRWSTNGDIRFTSYSDFQHVIQEQALMIYTNALASNDISSSITFYVSLTYISDNNGGLLIKTNIGYVSNINTETFQKVTPNWAKTLIKVHGLQLFKIEVMGLYTNTWSSQTGWTTGGMNTSTVGLKYPYEYATTEQFLLNGWYSYGTCCSRFTVVANGVTNIYTQAGAIVSSQIPRYISKSADGKTMSLSAKISRGSNVIITHSSNLSVPKSQWDIAATFSWSWPSESVTISWPINKDSKGKFFDITAQ